MINLNAWFQKHGLCAENILYIYRKDRKTVIQRTDGAEFALFVPVHSVLSTLPEKNFLSISKGIVVCRSHIVNISNDGVYTIIADNNIRICLLCKIYIFTERNR